MKPAITIDKALTAAELNADLMASIRRNLPKPWFVLIRIRLLKFLAELEK